MVWQFTKENWELLKERYQGLFLLSKIIDVSYHICISNYLEYLKTVLKLGKARTELYSKPIHPL